MALVFAFSLIQNSRLEIKHIMMLKPLREVFLKKCYKPVFIFNTFLVNRVNSYKRQQEDLLPFVWLYNYPANFSVYIDCNHHWHRYGQAFCFFLFFRKASVVRPPGKVLFRNQTMQEEMFLLSRLMIRCAIN